MTAYSSTAIARLEAIISGLQGRNQRALMFLNDAIEETGCTDDELIEDDAYQSSNMWVRIICARDELRATAGAEPCECGRPTSVCKFTCDFCTGGVS